MKLTRASLQKVAPTWTVAEGDAEDWAAPLWQTRSQFHINVMQRTLCINLSEHMQGGVQALSQHCLLTSVH